jgi:Fibronectin type III domain
MEEGGGTPPEQPGDHGPEWTWQGLPQSGPPPPPPVDTSAPQPPRRRIGVIIALALLVAGGILGAVFALSGGGSDSGTEAVSSSSPSSSPTPSPSPTETPPPLPPIGFIADADPLPIGVNLTWSPPAGGTEVSNYTIYRGKTRIASVPASVTEYTDTNVNPGKHYKYTIESRSGSILISDQVTAEIDVPTPANKDARVQGNFNVVANPTSQYGFQADFKKITLGWNFKPKCDEGACKVTWKDLTFKQLKVVLDRKGGTYTGDDTGKFNIKCGSVTVSSTVTIDIHVTKAKAISGEWRASKLEGTFTVTDPSELGCVSSKVVFSVTVKLL